MVTIAQGFNKTSSISSATQTALDLKANIASPAFTGTPTGTGIMKNGTPASATASGTAGEIQYDSNYIYICISTNNWKRVAISSWGGGGGGEF
tara:strand:- start:919 stop:1197 length:279 start_codon:yes stop_codon:yes gene_type:complete